MKDLFFCSGILIHLPNDGGPLGIHVVPDYDDSGKWVTRQVQNNA